MSTLKNSDHRRSSIWLGLPFLIGIIFMLGLIIHSGINTPFWDEWEMVPIFNTIDNGAIPLGSFWQQHNEHRIFFPNIVLTTSAYFTHWNTKVELLISLGFSVITALMLYLFILNKVTRPSLALTAAIFASAWFFSPIQYENWLWGWQVEWFMCIAGILSTIYFLDRHSRFKNKRNNLWLGLAIISAVISTYSLGAGILVWPIGLGILLINRQNRKSIVTWLITTILSIAAYYYHYKKPGVSPPTDIFLHKPADFIKYVISYLGRPISSDQQAAMIAGLVLLSILVPLVYAVWLKREDIRKFSVWIFLITLPIMASIITGVSRLGFGVAESMSSRYTAFSLLYIIGLIGLALTLADSFELSRNAIRLTIVILVSLSLPLLLSSYIYGFHGFSRQSSLLKEIKYCTHMPNPSNSCLSLTYPNPDVVRPRLNYIKSKHWSGY